MNNNNNNNKQSWDQVVNKFQQIEKSGEWGLKRKWGKDKKNQPLHPVGPKLNHGRNLLILILNASLRKVLVRKSLGSGGGSTTPIMGLYTEKFLQRRRHRKKIFYVKVDSPPLGKKTVRGVGGQRGGVPPTSFPGFVLALGSRFRCLRRQASNDMGVSSYYLFLWRMALRAGIKVAR